MRRVNDRIGKGENEEEEEIFNYETLISFVDPMIDISNYH